MKQVAKHTEAVVQAESELQQIDSTMGALVEETRSAKARSTADLLSGLIDAAKAVKLREQAER